MLTSFDLVAEPGSRLASTSTSGCLCPICARLEAAPHLQPKKLTKADKLRSLALQRQYAKTLAAQDGLELPDQSFAALRNDPALAESMALATYGEQLLQRCRGSYEGATVLALWREFAWTRAGSPKKGFELQAGAIVGARDQLQREIARLGTRS